MPCRRRALGFALGLVLLPACTEDTQEAGTQDSAGSTGGDTGATTTAADPTGDGTTTEDGSGSSGGTDEDANFISDPDGGPADIECSVWDQDCPEGDKCMPWVNDGGVEWNATKCVPLAADPGQPGDSCTAAGAGLSGNDDCELNAMCWNVNPETDEGVCVEMCSGSSQAPTCGDPSSSCSISNDGVLTLCLRLCDPLVQDCADGEACYAGVGTNDFYCSPNAAPDELGNFGDPCEFINVCNPGLFCAIPQAVPGCNASGCCSEFCDTTGDDDQCTGEGQSCIPYWEEGQAPPNYANVGVCLLPL